jgi:putative phosphoribosyl transferase
LSAPAGEQVVRIPLEREVALHGDLVVPESPAGMVVFAHGSGSTRRSPRNRMVAASLRRRNLGTLLVDLLSRDEQTVDARTRHLRFDIDLLARRLAGISAWLGGQKCCGQLPVGYFGASTGAAAALVAAARHPQRIGAVVSRGGRPDLAGDHLTSVRAPTELIVGGRDEVVLELNREACERLRVDRRLEVVPGADHLFEEPGAMEEVARLAGEWFTLHLASSAVG